MTEGLTDDAVYARLHEGKCRWWVAVQGLGAHAHPCCRCSCFHAVVYEQKEAQPHTK